MKAQLVEAKSKIAQLEPQIGLEERQLLQKDFVEYTKQTLEKAQASISG